MKYQRYIHANFQFNMPPKIDRNKGLPRNSGRGGNFDQVDLTTHGPDKQGYILVDGPMVPPKPMDGKVPTPRGYVELKPAYFKSEIFNMDRDKAYDRSVFKINDSGGKEFRIIGDDGPNPFRLSKMRYVGVGDSDVTGKYGNQLIESKLVDIEEHAWAIFCDPKE